VLSPALAVAPPLTKSAARLLTDEVKADAAALWAKLLSLYEGAAHTALGYSSWAAYCADEFDMGRDYSYKLLSSARVVEALGESTFVDSPPRSEAVARELVPVLREAPEEVPEVWGEVVDLHGPTPTAAQVREVVDEKRADKMAVHYSSATDEWATPQDFYDAVNDEFGFDLDVCALETSAKCDRYFTPDTDGLAQEWTGTVWMNPPYGDVIKDWVAKAHQSALAGATVVCLVPARTDTAWFHDHCFPGEVRFIKGRLRFGQAEASAPFPSALVILGPAIEQRAYAWNWRA
jgi:phage N-6-adenine-methyltransferase